MTIDCWLSVAAMKKKSPKLARTESMYFKVTPEQRAMIEQRAARSGVRVSYWMRSVVLQAASLPAKAGHVRVREPTGVTA